MLTKDLLNEYADLAQKEEEYAQVGDVMSLTSTQQAMSVIQRQLEIKSI